MMNNAISNNTNILEINNVCETWKSTIKIELKDGSKASGFFIKYSRNNKPFYCLMTNQHVIDDELTKKDEEILIKYENEKRQLKIELNKEERIIICFKKILNIDLTVVEIIPKDSIDESYFLLPNFNYEKKSNT